jgi:hypothetical protein
VRKIQPSDVEKNKEKTEHEFLEAWALNIGSFTQQSE